MGSLSIWHILVIVVLVMLLFGRGKVSELMGDVAKGIKNFRDGMKEEPKPQPQPQQINPPHETPIQDHVKADGTKV